MFGKPMQLIIKGLNCEQKRVNYIKLSKRVDIVYDIKIFETIVMENGYP